MIRPTLSFDDHRGPALRTRRPIARLTQNMLVLKTALRADTISAGSGGKSSAPDARASSRPVSTGRSGTITSRHIDTSFHLLPIASSSAKAASTMTSASSSPEPFVKVHNVLGTAGRAGFDDILRPVEAD